MSGCRAPGSLGPVSAAPRTPRHPARSGRSRLVRRAAVVVLLLGLLGMHALGTHGTGHEPTAGGHHAQADAGHVAPVLAPSAPDGGHASGSLMAMCLVVLVAAAALLLAGPARGRGSGWAPDTGRAPPASAVGVVPRSSRPPPAWRFSVLRC